MEEADTVVGHRARILVAVENRSSNFAWDIADLAEEVHSRYGR